MSKNLAKKQHNKVRIYLIFVICAAIIIQVIILNAITKKNGEKTARVLLDQVVSILDKNQEYEKELIEDLKVEYISKAKSVSYIISLNPNSKNDAKELQKIADYMGVDEIHIFDSNGIIYAGTVQKYYGVSFNDGEQVAYFKPMLNDKNLTMCQDVTPNTAEEKNMMYAIVWDEAGSNMIQVGIEPVRLLEELKSNEIPEVISNIPVYKDLNIYVAEADTNVICGSTDKSSVDKSLSDLNMLCDDASYDMILNSSCRIDGKLQYYQYKKINDYIVVVSFSNERNSKSFSLALVSEFLFLLLAGIVISTMFRRVISDTNKINEQFSVLSSMSDIYYSIHLIDLEKNTVKEYTSKDIVKQIVNHENGADDMMRSIINLSVYDEFLEDALEFTDLKTLSDRMKGKKIITTEFEGRYFGWCIASFISIEKDDDDRPTKVIFTTRDIDYEKKKEQKLIDDSTTDELTGFRNRRAYEDDILRYNDTITEDDFVYISMDVNGLKIVNDTLGHSVGDELIRGAASCMKRCFGPYGRIYRIGGDEFSAIIFANEDTLNNILKDFEDTTANWTSDNIDSLTVSYGSVHKQEVNTTSVREIAVLADEKMYEQKTAFYNKKGLDRRGQKEAHKALCNLYTKILKINITEDTYQIVNMDVEEQTSAKGFSNSISEWLTEFGKSGQVHADDLDEYLSKTNIEYMREYFKQDKTSLHIFYRRKIDDAYKNVMMEIIPSSDYTNEDQNLFLYVKNIDK